CRGTPTRRFKGWVKTSGVADGVGVGVADGVVVGVGVGEASSVGGGSATGVSSRAFKSARWQRPPRRHQQRLKSLPSL
ncbi:MAG: hypothetical protein AAGA67_10550, partial [Cyanobacteria bacterium P01_F01_bin.153]